MAASRRRLDHGQPQGLGGQPAPEQFVPLGDGIVVAISVYGAIAQTSWRSGPELFRAGTIAALTTRLTRSNSSEVSGVRSMRSSSV